MYLTLACVSVVVLVIKDAAQLLIGISCARYSRCILFATYLVLCFICFHQVIRKFENNRRDNSRLDLPCCAFSWSYWTTYSGWVCECCVARLCSTSIHCIWCLTALMINQTRRCSRSLPRTKTRRDITALCLTVRDVWVITL